MTQPSFEDLARSLRVARAGTRRRHVAPSLPPEGTIQDRFEAFHAAHPEVYAGLVRLARQLRARGRRRWSIDALFHVLRWEWTFSQDDAEDFKLNNNYTSRYARLIREQEPELSDLFEVRSLHA